MNLQDLLTEAEYAMQRGVSVRTVQRERALRKGPAFIKLGKSIFYRREAISAWLLSQEQTPAGKAA
jgi:hypothetical protein